MSIVDRVATITTPNADWFGAETITFKATDPGGLFDDNPATFTVTLVNDPPVITDIPDQTIAEGCFYLHQSGQLCFRRGQYRRGDDLTYSGNAQLIVSIVDRVATITTNADWFGAETITFKATDPGALFDTDPATFTVTNVNDPPAITEVIRSRRPCQKTASRPPSASR